MYCIIDAILSQIRGKITVAKKPQKVVLFSNTQVLLFLGLKSTTFIGETQNHSSNFYRQMQNHGN